MTNLHLDAGASAVAIDLITIASGRYTVAVSIDAREVVLPEVVRR